MTASAFEIKLEVRWDDLDANRHARNTAFSEFASTARFHLLVAHGFDQTRLERMRFGPVMMREDIRYRRELFFGEVITVRVHAAGLSADGSHWRVYQEVLRPDGKDAATLSIQGGWIQLDDRKLVAPPEELAAVLASLPRTADFEELPSLLKR
jgi:acyl-CoA thioester hydrolase